ncbi:unnamed protein product [Adineta steineri]|uniref:Chorein N-terminal domain-containing protein n=1 Tax=Adineta steineri TaxID=433720 RepID=A0A813SK98_9BILA|nr:unnamed protein product [Adineta steineri]
MIFKRIIIYLIDKYLGNYIQNLDTQNLKFDLWHGNVTLENLNIKPDALANFNIPVTIITGYIQKLSFHISWKHLYHHPINIIIDGFYIIAEPNTEIKHNAEQEEKKQYKAKMKEVHKIEEFRKEQEEFVRSKRSPRQSDTFLERLQLHIIRHFEFSISNIHISFEDKITKPNRPFIFGITLNYIKFQTTNNEWEHMKLIEDSPVIYKFGELNTFSIYWNCDVKFQSKENPIEDLHAKIMKNNETSMENMSYILRPSDIKAKLKIATLPKQQEYVRPILDVKIDFKQIHLNITHDQYSDLLDLLELRDNIKLRSQYKKYYESIETDKPSLRRWKFAYAVVINEVVRPRLGYYQWENIRENLDRCREYHALYFKERNEQATRIEKQRARKLEKQIDVLNLVFIRRNVELDIKKNKVEKKQKYWWDRLFHSWSDNSHNNNTGKLTPNIDIILF